MDLKIQPIWDWAKNLISKRIYIYGTLIFQENEMYHDAHYASIPSPPKRLPILALNEVFIGESLSAR